MNSLTPKEVAELLQIKTNTVYEMVKRGELNAYRIGRKMRIDPMEVEIYKEKRSIGLNRPANVEVSKDTDDSVIICGNDIFVDILIKYLEPMDLGVKILRSYLSSYNGIFALYKGEVNIATSHLWDGKTDTYNVEYIEKMMPGVGFVAINLVKRWQGIYVKEGNPHDITSLKDLEDKDITVILREMGSGSRVLFDEYMMKYKLDSWKIRGYKNELKTDMATAGMIAKGDADLSIGKETSVNQIKGVSFIPLKEESLDMIIRKEDMEKPLYQTIIKVLNSDEFRNEISYIAGYNIENMGKIVFKRG